MNFTHILVPTDLSEPSLRALRLAVKMARHGRARLTLVHVVPPQVSALAAEVPGWTAFDPELVNRWQQELEANAQHELQRIGKEEIPDDVPWVTEVVSGTVENVIVERCTALGCDLVTMGTVGRTGLPHLLLGSVAERVMARSPVPVLVTH